MTSILDGAVDLHVHPAPSPMPRRITTREAAELANAAGFRAIVVKSHHHSTVTDVLGQGLGDPRSPTRVFGGVALNNAVGGLNAHAVDLALKLGGRIVWFPTIASSQHISHHARHPELKFPQATRPLRPERPIDVLDEDGRLKPEVDDILDAIAEADAILATGHMAPRQITAVLKAGRKRGVQRMLVNHPNFVIEATYEDARTWVALGAKIEHSLCMYDDRSTFHNWDLDTLVKWIEAIGPTNSILASDLGQVNNPLPADAFQAILSELLNRGMPERELRQMISDNPAELLGLD